MNRYDTEHAVTAHATMTSAEWEQIYRAAWDAYYSPKHLKVIMRRAGVTGINLSSLAGTLLHFSLFTELEGVHPLQGGFFRLKFRHDRRPGLAIEPAIVFYPRLLWGIARKLLRFARAGRHLYGLAKTIKADPQKNTYMDQALSPAIEEDLESLDLFIQNDAARSAVRHERRVRELTAAPAS